MKALAVTTASTGSPATLIDVGKKIVSGYPALTDDALGTLQFLWRKCHIEDDWSKTGEISDAWDRWTIFPWYMYARYDLEWMTRLISKIAAETPAWREGYTEMVKLLCDRMTQYASWFDMVEQKGLDPNRNAYPYAYYINNMPPGWAGVYNAPGFYGNGLQVHVPPKEVVRGTPYTQRHAPGVGRPYNPDPIWGNGGSYMMGKGYFLNMLAHYELISGKQFDNPVEFVYDDEIRFSYTHDEIAQVLYDQFMAEVDDGGTTLTPGIDCEVGKVFPWCVSVGGMAMHLTDKLHGTNTRTGYYRWLDWIKQENMVGGAETPDGPYNWATIYYDRDIPYNMNGPQHQIPGNWLCCAYQYSMSDLKLATRLYEGAINKFMITEPDGSAHINLPPELGGGEDLVGFGAAVSCAWEFGDYDTHARLQRWANDHYQPTRKDGEFYYKFGIDEQWPRGWPNDWMLMSVAGGPGSWQKMHNDPDIKKFHQPTLVGVNYPDVAVRQAKYDESIGALVLSITAGSDGKLAGEKTTFRIENLNPSKDHHVLMDGSPYNGWKAVTDTEISIDTTIAEHSFVIR
jgi:hypothetical protein